MTHKGTKKACILLAIKQIRLNHKQHKKRLQRKMIEIKIEKRSKRQENEEFGEVVMKKTSLMM